MPDFFVARQPVYSIDLKLFAYELLCRSGSANSYAGRDAMEATSKVILHVFTEIGLEKLAGAYPVLIKTPRQFLLGDFPLSCPPQRVYLELLPNERLDAELIDVLMRLSRSGYRLVLPGVPEEPEARGLLDRADLIKLDMRRLGTAGLQRQVVMAVAHQRKLCGEKVETQTEYDKCRELGIPFVQGFFFCRPRMHRAKHLMPNRAALLQLLAKLNDERSTVDDLTKNISQDAALTYKLLRTLNSAFMGLPTKITSIRQGVVLIGLDRVRVWATMIIVSKLIEKPHELMVTSLVRMRMCERLGAALHLGRLVDACSMVGLLSVLDAMMDMPITFIVEKLPVAPEVSQALTS